MARAEKLRNRKLLLAYGIVGFFPGTGDIPAGPGRKGGILLLGEGEEG